MTSDIGILAVSAASIGLVHTLTGPDHYIPFVAIGRARKWSLRKTLSITAVCGLGHVLGSIVLGSLGIGLGLAVGRLEVIEGVRGDLAAWLLISIGLIYGAWGLRRAWTNRPHTHSHAHADGTIHNHSHSHHESHAHPHPDERKAGSLTPWALFVIFVLGPCEPLIPILMYPAARFSISGLVGVAAIFAVVTIATMLGMVYLTDRGVKLLPVGGLCRYAHALAGMTIMGSGLAIRFLDL